MREIILRRPHTIEFSVYKDSDKPNLQKQKVDQWFPQGEAGGGMRQNATADGAKILLA